MDVWGNIVLLKTKPLGNWRLFYLLTLKTNSIMEENESIIENLKLTYEEVLTVVKEWYTNGMCPDIFESEEGEDLEEYIERQLL